MPTYAKNDRVRVSIGGTELDGTLIDINMFKKSFKVHTDRGDIWIQQSQIVEKIPEGYPWTIAPCGRSRTLGYPCSCGACPDSL